MGSNYRECVRKERSERDMRTTKTKTPRLSRNGPRILTRVTKNKTSAKPKTAREIKTLLVATDFSELSLNALRVAKMFAEEFGATVQVITVLEPAPFIAGMESI